MESISSFVIPTLLVLIALVLFFSKRDLFQEFLVGAKDGLQTSIHLLPTLVALMVGIGMFSASGAVEFLVTLLRPLGNLLGIPVEILPLLLIRPLSGSASTALINDLFAQYGADSFPAQCASVIMGSSDTLVYIIAVYFSSVSIRKTRHAFPAAFCAMLFCIFFACFICRVFAVPSFQ